MTCAPRGIFKHHVGEGGRNTKKRTLGARRDQRALELAPMTSSCWTMPGVGVEGRAVCEGDEVVPVLRVDEHDALAHAEFGATHELTLFARRACIRGPRVDESKEHDRQQRVRATWATSGPRPGQAGRRSTMRNSRRRT